MSLLAPETRFIGARPNPTPGSPAIFGVPYDKTASFRKGSCDGPDAIREVSDAAIETYSPIQGRDLQDYPYCDLGNLSISQEMESALIHDIVLEATRELYEQETVPVLLGGEHSVSTGAIRAAFEQHPDLVVIQIDAHADLRESYEGEPHSHACAMRRVLDFLPSDKLLQVGIRSGTRDEFQEMEQHDRLIKPSGLAISDKLKEGKLSSAPVWVTFDIDVFDPSEAPGTGTPEAGGISYAEADSIRSALEGRTMVGFDLVEIAPGLDPSGITSALGAKLLREWLLTIMGNQ